MTSLPRDGEAGSLVAAGSEGEVDELEAGERAGGDAGARSAIAVVWRRGMSQADNPEITARDTATEIQPYGQRGALRCSPPRDMSPSTFSCSRASDYVTNARVRSTSSLIWRERSSAESNRVSSRSRSQNSRAIGSSIKS